MAAPTSIRSCSPALELGLVKSNWTAITVLPRRHTGKLVKRLITVG
ncbi:MULTISPECIES: hypothetical protein [unclassified Rhodococcus (in: high G+C Gram-positive bacteria)]|nr:MULTISPECIES: hypothetical protein [unclassified Rhodococcus (in: high G+C Gram-positive bacteria)]MBC2640606.1 hypothetical protein [Rhodococcus sp. 3A]MBC2894648.1 hypothetical protein [Rhodococcus sp. 4CII]